MLVVGRDISSPALPGLEHVLLVGDPDKIAKISYSR
jgi:hypothetical protein